MTYEETVRVLNERLAPLICMPIVEDYGEFLGFRIKQSDGELVIEYLASPREYWDKGDLGEIVIAHTLRIVKEKMQFER